MFGVCLGVSTNVLSNIEWTTPSSVPELFYTEFTGNDIPGVNDWKVLHYNIIFHQELRPRITPVVSTSISVGSHMAWFQNRHKGPC